MFRNWSGADDRQEATTVIMKQTIIPVSTYKNTEFCLNKVCNELLKTPYRNIQDSKNSLTQAWGQDKNYFWQCYKQAAVALAVDYLNHDDMNPKVLSLYALLADCRRIIADNLNQRKGISGEFIGVSRPCKMRNMRDKRDMTHFFADKGPYTSFYPTLNDLFSINSNDSSEIHIMVDNHCVSIIHRDEYHMSITHCDESDNSFDVLSSRIAESYQKYQSASDSHSVLRATSELIYYFSLAMPLVRGSAACVEMMSQALLLHKGLNLQYKDEKNIALDLRAFYSKNVDEFADFYMNNHIKYEYEMNNVHTGLFERRELIDNIIKKYKSLSSEMKKSDKDMPACIQKQRVLLAAVNYLNDLIELDKFKKILENSPEFSVTRGMRSSDTSILVNDALKLKTKQKSTGRLISLDTSATQKRTPH